MKRYAFFDVQNTETTTLKVLGFEIDHERLFLYLKEKWQCEKVFFYPGIEYGDSERENIFNKISTLGGIVRIKYYYKYKNKDKIKEINCPNCYTKIEQKINMGYTWKCNCDVEMTMDILDCARTNTELLIFTGDGDFGSLVEKVIRNGVKTYLISSYQKTESKNIIANSRFAKKLKMLIEKYSEMIIYIEINDWKMRIQKVPKYGDNF